MDRDLWTLLAGYLLLVNLAGFLLMGLDKRRARRGAWRISEKALFLPAVLGGSLGSIVGMRTFEALVFPIRAARPADRSAGAGCPSGLVFCEMNGLFCNIMK